MRLSASFLAVLMFFAVVTILLTNSSSAQARGGNCQDKLVGKFYNCTGKDSEGGTVTGCIEFASGGLSMDFDLFAGGNDYGCVCDTTGSIKSPSFDGSSSAFACVTNGILINGKVKSKKVTAQAIDESGSSQILSCTGISTHCE
jgi:hypothetical protein